MSVLDSDMALVTRVAMLHDKRAFDQLVRRYQSPVRRFFLHQTLGDSQLSDDLAQDTFIKAYTNIGQFRAMSSFKTWLMRIAYNVHYDYRRSQKGVELSTESVEYATALDGSAGRTAAANSTLYTFNSTLNMDLHQALAILKDVERTCITLQLIDGRPIDEIADITGMPQNTVKSHLRRGKEKLTDYLKRNGYDQ